MSVNLNKNKAELLKAWEEIHDPNGKNNWVIFGYSGQYTDLKIVGQGEDGIEEMVDDLSGGKILYAGVRVTDPNTNLPKIVFINWQGEGVPATVKGKCANHLRDITGLFRGVHVQINARNDDDVDEDVIMEKVKNSSGANYGFHKEKPKAFIPQGNIGTNYERQRPDLDINVQQKDKFWAQKEKEEKQRKEEEVRHANEERIAESRQRSEREKREAAARDEVIKSRERRVSEQRADEQKESEQRKEEEKRKYNETMQQSERDDEEFRRRSDSERRKRLQEANQLIRKRQESFGDSSPRDTFDKEPAKAPPPVTAPKKKVLPAPPRKPSPEPVRQPSPEPVRQPSPEPVRQPSPEPVRQPTPEPVRQPSPEPVRQPSPEPVREPTPEPVRQPSPEPMRESLPPVPVEPTKSLPSEPADELYDNIDDVKEIKHVADNSQSNGLTARALYDYQAVDASEITFDPEDIITNIEKIDEGWWKGTAPNGAHGMFPANYVELIDSPPQVESTPSAGNGVCAKALYDYQAADETEITFDPDDIIRNIEQIDDGWWRGDGPDGRNGLFPANYVELIS